MNKKLLITSTLLAASSLILTSCDVGTFLEILDSITASIPFDSTRADVSADLSYIEEGTGFKAEKTKYIYEDILDSNGNYPCRSYGDINLLVIPVAIKGHEDVATEDNLARIKKTFFGKADETSWQSVSSFYKKSSYGAFNLNGVIPDKWYNPGFTTDDLTNMKAKAGTHNAAYYESTWDVLEGAVDWYKTTYGDDCKQFDNDNDGYIDGVWLVYGCNSFQRDNTLNQKLFWAYNYKDYSVTAGNLLSPVAYSYCWASYDFMDVGYGETGIDAHTYIHETGHLIGLDDYYVASLQAGEDNYAPMAALDMMDYNIIDHNAFSKFALGWTRPYVVTDATEITLAPSNSSGQAIILPTSKGWNGTAFDEYMMLEYYTPNGLNYMDSVHGYSYYPKGFSDSGVRIYHVDARMAIIKSSGAVYGNEINGTEQAFIPQSNSSGYNKNNVDRYFGGKNPEPNFLRYRLIQEMDCTNKRNFDTESTMRNGQKTGVYADNSTLFKAGSSFTYSDYKESFPNYKYNKEEKMNNQGTLPWKVSFSEMNDAGIKVTIEKI